MGNLTEVTDESGELVGSARYDAFGRILENTIPPTVTNRLYAYSIYDADTGLYKIGARWYDAQVGVWLTPDSIVPDLNKPVAWNRYAFNYNNPVNYVDPSGHIPVWDILDVGSFVWSGIDFFRSPSWANLGWWALDAVGLLPLLPSAGTIKRSSNLVDNTVKIALHADEAHAAKIYDVLNNTDAGADIVQKAGIHGLPSVRFGNMSDMGRYLPDSNRIVLNADYLKLSPELAAPTLAHELSHRTRRWYSHSLADEVFAHQTQSRVWSELRGCVNMAASPDMMRIVEYNDSILNLAVRGDNALIQHIKGIYGDLPLRSKNLALDPIYTKYVILKGY